MQVFRVITRLSDSDSGPKASFWTADGVKAAAEVAKLPSRRTLEILEEDQVPKDVLEKLKAAI